MQLLYILRSYIYIHPQKYFKCPQFSQFSHSVMSNSLQSRESQHSRPPCPSPTPGVYPNSCPSSRWYHPVISSSVVPFSSCPQSLPASGSFPMNQLITWGGQSTGVSASASVLSMNTHDWSLRTGWTVGSPGSPRDSEESSRAPQWKHRFFRALPSLWSNIWGGNCKYIKGKIPNFAC